MKRSICLNMIVKNESQVILRCLDSVKAWIDCWVIVDTGSTDGTQELILDALSGIPGQLHESPWVDFAHNRNEALGLAKDKADYLLFLDADDELVFTGATPLLELDYYHCVQRQTNATSSSYVLLLAASHLDWRWNGVIHERLLSTQAKSHAVLHELYNLYHEDGCRSKNPQKYLDDAALLEKEPDNERSVFFLAESLRWAGAESRAIEAYRKRAAMGGAAEEVYWSLYCLAQLTKDFSAFCQAHQFRPSRIEPLYDLGNQCIEKRWWLLLWLISRYALPSPLSNDLLHVDSWIYDWGILLHTAISSAKLGKKEAALDAFHELLKKESLPDLQRTQILQSIQ